MFSSDGAQSKRGSRVLLQTNCTLVRQRLCPGTAPQNSKNVFRLVPRPSPLLDLLTFMLNFLQYFNRLWSLGLKNCFLQISSYSIRCICTQNLWKVKGVHFLTPSLGKQNTQAKEVYFGIELSLHCWLFKWRHFVTWTITNIAWSGLGALNSTTASRELYFEGGGGGGGRGCIWRQNANGVVDRVSILTNQTVADNLTNY